MRIVWYIHIHTVYTHAHTYWVVLTHIHTVWYTHIHTVWFTHIHICCVVHTHTYILCGTHTYILCGAHPHTNTYSISKQTSEIRKKFLSLAYTMRKQLLINLQRKDGVILGK